MIILFSWLLAHSGLSLAQERDLDQLIREQQRLAYEEIARNQKDEKYSAFSGKGVFSIKALRKYALASEAEKKQAYDEWSSFLERAFFTVSDPREKMTLAATHKMTFEQLLAEIETREKGLDPDTRAYEKAMRLRLFSDAQNILVGMKDIKCQANPVSGPKKPPLTPAAK